MWATKSQSIVWLQAQEGMVTTTNAKLVLSSGSDEIRWKRVTIRPSDHKTTVHPSCTPSHQQPLSTPLHIHRIGRICPDKRWPPEFPDNSSNTDRVGHKSIHPAMHVIIIIRIILSWYGWWVGSYCLYRGFYPLLSNCVPFGVLFRAFLQ